MKKSLLLPVYENWLAFKKEASSNGHFEYEILSDAIITGENTVDFGPYQFINPCNRATGVKAVLILRFDNRLPRYSERAFDMKTTNVDCYHGGGLVDEVAAIISLTMGVRAKAGRLTREFTPSDNKFGRPVGWQDTFIPKVEPEHGQYKLPSVICEANVKLLVPLRCLSDLSGENVTFLVKAARLYQQALWIAESDPTLSWIMLVSALETAVNQWKKHKASNSERLKFDKEDLYEYLASLNIPNLVDTVANYLSNSLGASKNFVNFVMTFLPSPPDKRPPEHLQCVWDSKELEKIMKLIYNYRSKALHGGIPFPFPMCESPYYPKDFQAPAEKPFGLGCYANSGVWAIEDTPMVLNTFEYIARNCLLKWWNQLR